MIECRVCKENQDLKQYGEYKGRRGLLRRKTCNTCRREQEAKRYSENPLVRARMKSRAAEYHLNSRYGITILVLNSMHEKVSNKCEICSFEWDKLHVDHCHSTGKIRGLLCGSCNRALGLFKDSIINLKSAISYLEESQIGQS